MATESVLSQLGLFNSPEQYQQNLATGALRRGVELAQLTPEQYGRAIGYSGASQIGRGLAGAMGAEDPMLQLISQRQSILRGIDRTNPQSVFKAAQALGQLGDTATATQLVKDAQEAAFKQSQIVKNLRERPEKESELAMLQSERADIVAKYGENDPRVKQYDARIAKITTGGGIGAEIAAGLGPLVGAMAVSQAKKAGEAGGTEVGKQSAAIQGKYTALGSIKDAVDMLDKGIYSGGYGPLQEAAAKYSGGLIRKDRLANTQEFRAYIGDVVIPRLQEFGGNDSVEELNYLRSVMAGDTSMEGSAIKNILKRADSKIRAGITRLEKQQEAVTTGRPLPLGDTGTPPAAPRATKRFNPATGQVEAI